MTRIGVWLWMVALAVTGHVGQGQEASATYSLARHVWFRGHHSSAASLLTEAARQAPDQPEIRFWAGHLLYETGQLKAALEQFERAAQAAPDSDEVQLYLGGARYAVGDKEKALETWEKLRDSKAKGVASAAKDACERLGEAEAKPWVMVVNPMRPTPAGRLAVEAQPGQFDLVPEPADADELVKLAEANRRLPRHCVRLAFLASRLAPESASARAAYAQALENIDRTPEALQELEAAARLATTDQELAACQQLHQAMVAGHPELELEPAATMTEPGFLIRYQPGEPALPTLVQALRLARTRVQELFGLDPDEVYVRAFSSREAYAAYSQMAHPRAVVWSGAYAVTGKMGLVMWFHRGGAIQEMSMAAHEYTHLATHMLTGGRWGPEAWMNEGIARLVESTVNPTPAEAQVREARHQGRLLTPQQLTLAFKQIDAQVAGLAYAESEKLIAYLVKTRGASALMWMLGSFGAGIEPGKAFTRYAGVTPDQFFAEWVQAGCP